jgi:hypothetical protein
MHIPSLSPHRMGGVISVLTSDRQMMNESNRIDDDRHEKA